MIEAPVAWRRHWQDFTGHVPGIGLTRPKPQDLTFPTKEAAEAARAGMVITENIVVTITPVYTKRRAPRKAAPAFAELMPLPMQPRKQAVPAE